MRARFHKDDTLVAGLTFHSAYTEGALEPESGIWSPGAESHEVQGFVHTTPNAPNAMKHE